MLDRERGKRSNILWSYIGLFTVIFVWGIIPVGYEYAYKFYSPSLFGAITTFIAFLLVFFAYFKKIKGIEKKSWIVAIVGGFFNGSAYLLQKLGLYFGATPTQYAFLENLTCVVVPILMFFVAKQKPTLIKILASILCLFSAFILSGGFSGGTLAFNFSVVLCALAGVFYGINMTVTSVYAKDVPTAFYITVQFAEQTVITLIYALLFEKTYFSFKPFPLAVLLFVGVISTAFCYFLRTESLKKLDATFVAIAMPFGAVVTGILSVITGSDTLSLSLVLGGTLGLIAVIASGLSDVYSKRKENGI